MNRFYCTNIAGQETATLNEEESQHCIKVLRQQVGDQVILFDGNGTEAQATIIDYQKKRVSLKINEERFFEPDPYFLHVAIAPTKQNDRIEWFLEKSTEFGIHKITFITTMHSERTTINLDRFKKIVLSAAKQSKAVYLPTLEDQISFKKWISLDHTETNKLIATLIGETKTIQFNELKNEKVVALIGPEGGFSQQEVEHAIDQNFTAVNLGKKRLRTETAGLFFSSSLYQIHLNK